MVLKRKTKQKFMALLLAAACIFSNQGVFAQQNAPEEYSAYVSRYAESAYSTRDIVCKLDEAVLDTQVLEFEVDVEESAFYGVGMSYKAMESRMSAISIGLMIDGAYPYARAESLAFPRMWCNESDERHYTTTGDEFAPPQVLYPGFYYNEAIDETAKDGERVTVYLAEGTHRVSIVPNNDVISIEYITFYALAPGQTYTAPENKSELYQGRPILIEGEAAALKSSYFLVGKSDAASMLVTPHSAEKSLLNYIGGGNWKTVGDTLIWNTPELEAGYYQLGFSYRQNSVIGGKSYRTLMIDGKVPFEEAEAVGFAYGDDWQQEFYSDENGTPYLTFLSKGRHEIALRVTNGGIGQVRALLTDAVAEMGSLYIDMTKITGETVDIYRDYDLFRHIGDMQERLENIRSSLEESGKLLLAITGETSGSNYSVMKNMAEVINQMLDNRYEAHKYKNYYYSNYCSVSSVLQELRYMPLDIDKIALTAAGEKTPFEKPGLLKQAVFSAKRFIVSFTRDYQSVSAAGETGENAVNIWVSWGRDQAQVLSSLIERSFTPQTGIPVNVKLVNASVIQATLSGNAPDCFLQMVRSEPVNLAMRNILYDLTQFEDCDEVLTRFQKGADIPYRYKDKLFALPDTQTFFAMFYRKDILDTYGLAVPRTWEEFDLAAKLLMRNNMSVSLPNYVATDAAQTSAGVGANNIYPSLLLQNKVPLYAEDGQKTNLLSADAMEVFEKWTDYYRKMKLPVTLDFYNRFRTGTTPIGIASYTLYTTLKATAAEIDGLWDITSIPGTLQQDGSIAHTSSGGGTGATILKSSKNPEGAWAFLKWWTQAETQTAYSNGLESILGPTGRIGVSNMEAMQGLSWDDDALERLLMVWSEVEEIPEYPGSYYVSRSVYQAFWNVINDNRNTKDMLMKFGKEADDEIARKWKQYANR